MKECKDSFLTPAINKTSLPVLLMFIESIISQTMYVAVSLSTVVWNDRIQCQALIPFVDTLSSGFVF